MPMMRIERVVMSPDSMTLAARLLLARLARCAVPGMLSRNKIDALRLGDVMLGPGRWLMLAGAITILIGILVRRWVVARVGQVVALVLLAAGVALVGAGYIWR